MLVPMQRSPGVHKAKTCRAKTVIFLFVLNTQRALRDIWLPRHVENNFIISEKIKNLQFTEYAQYCSAYISATKYLSETFLYSKQTGGYPLSSDIKSQTDFSIF